jgi:hypothetical protein
MEEWTAENWARTAARLPAGALTNSCHAQKILGREYCCPLMKLVPQ